MFRPTSIGGHFVSIIAGETTLDGVDAEKPLKLGKGSHAYIPAGREAVLEADSGAEFVIASSPTEAQAPGERLLVRDEQFLAACSVGTGSMRWVLTPQYLSRRVILHHDRLLLSKTGQPVSWFHTTMFDTDGLPPNNVGESTFKMSYSYQTESNVCYKVTGRAAVRMAKPPYRPHYQRWNPWISLDQQTNYRLDETYVRLTRMMGANDRSRFSIRNKHEIWIADGHVSLFCLFDPAPTGFERHEVGKYSEYGSPYDMLETEKYKEYLKLINPLDRMVDTLSLAKAEGRNDLDRLPEWRIYERGIAFQHTHERSLLDRILADRSGRDQILKQWTLKAHL